MLKMRNSVRMLNRWLDIAEEGIKEVKYSSLENIHIVTEISEYTRRNNKS